MSLPNTEVEIPEWIELLSEEQKQFYREQSIELAVKINGQVVGIQRFLFTFGIIVGADETGYHHRYCYGSSPEAYIALCEWIAHGGDEPKNYIKRKG